MNRLNFVKNHYRQMFVLLLLTALAVNSLTGHASTLPLTVAAQESTSGDAAPASIANGRIAFEGNRDGNSEIYVMNADGSVQINLTDHPAEDRVPTWSPDGSRLAFTSTRDGNREIYVMDEDGSNVVRLTNNQADDFAFDWSPDGTRLSLTSRRDGNSELYIMNADGTNQTRLTTNTLEDISPNWSPDGTRLVFIKKFSLNFGNDEIYTIDVNTLTEINITNTLSSYFKPTWSPDGTKISFWSTQTGNNEVFVMNANGSNRINLTNNPRDDYYPSWSPDGTKIVFSSNRDLNYPRAFNNEIYVMNLDGSNPTRLINHPASDSDSNWQPRAADQTFFPNPIEDAAFFVRQHYYDFLNREPDAPGFNFWTNNIISCNIDAGCIEVKRIDTSAAFFLSIEFQETGYLAYRFYKAAYPASPARPRGFPRYAEFLLDMQLLGNNVRVNVGNWQAQLEGNKIEYANQFVQTDAFKALYPDSMTAAQYVDALNANTGGALDAQERDTHVTRLNNQMETRATVLRKVAEDQTFFSQEFNRAFVLMQYFGYLRRNPDDAPEPTRDYAGYDFWLGKLNEFGGDYRRAEMVKAFITSPEYRDRFDNP